MFFVSNGPTLAGKRRVVEDLGEQGFLLLRNIFFIFGLGNKGLNIIL